MARIKKCKQCGNSFAPYYSSLQVVCSPECALKFNSKKEADKRVKQMKVNIKNDTAYETLQALINTIVRLIDRGHDCISSGTKYGQYKVAAGHYYSVGSNPTLRYNLLNIYNQSWSDNGHKGGKGSNYGLRLKEVFGADVRDEIEGLVSKYPTLKMTRKEALEYCKIAGQIIKELKDIEIIFSTEYRIEVRKKINERLGIYK